MSQYVSIAMKVWLWGVVIRELFGARSPWGLRLSLKELFEIRFMPEKC